MASQASKSKQVSATSGARDCYYIIGIYHPPATPKSKIVRADRTDVMYPKALRELNETIVGKPITVMHPPEVANCMSANWGTNVRGKCVWSKVLDDGNAVFIGEMPVDRRNVKTLLTKQAIENGQYESISLGHRYDEMVNRHTGETKDVFQADHIAIVPTGKERRPGCRIMSLSTFSADTNKNRQRPESAVARKEMLANFIERIRQENSNLVYQLMRDSTATKNNDDTSNMSTENNQHQSAAPADVTQQINSNVEQRMAAQRENAAAQQQQLHQQTMTDDNSKDPEQEMIDRLSSQPKEIVSQVATQVYRELEEAKAQLAEMQRERDQIVATTREQKKAELAKRIKDIENYMFNLRTISLDGSEVSEDAQKSHRQEARKAANVFMPANDDLESLNHAMNQADAWTSHISAIQVASVDGAARASEYSRLMNRHDEHSVDRVRGIMRAGISSRHMKHGSPASHPASRFSVNDARSAASSQSEHARLSSYIDDAMRRNNTSGGYRSRSSVVGGIEYQLQKAQDTLLKNQQYHRSNFEQY